MDPTPEQLEAQASALASVVTCLGELIGPDFQESSAYYADDNFTIDMSADDGGNTVVHVYLLEMDGDLKTNVLVLGPDGYREGVWLSKLQERATAIANARPTPTPPAPEPSPWDPINDTALFEGQS